MIAPRFWSSWWAFAFMVGPFLLIIVSFMLSLYIARHLAPMVSALKNRRYIVTRPDLRHQGWFGRFMLVSIIGGRVQWPGPGLRKGEMDLNDLKSFPEHLSKHIKIKHVLTLIIVIWSLIIYVLTN